MPSTTSCKCNLATCHCSVDSDMMIYETQTQKIRSGLFGLVSQLSWRTSSSSLEEKGEDGERFIRKTQFSCSFSLLSSLCATCMSEEGPVVGKRVRPSCHLPKPVCCDPSMGHFNYSSPPPLSLCCLFLQPV